MSSAETSPLIVKGRASQIEIRRQGAGLHVVATGSIDEGAKFEELNLRTAAELNPADRIMIDAGDVTRINSIGIRAWLSFMAALGSKGPLHFQRVSEAIFEQFLIRSDLLSVPGTPVDVIELAYSCGQCDTREPRQLPTADLFSAAGKFTPPAQKCPTCHMPLEVDALPEDLEMLRDHLRKP